MTMNGSGIRDTSRVLSISQGVVMSTIKKATRSRRLTRLFCRVRNEKVILYEHVSGSNIWPFERRLP